MTSETDFVETRPIKIKKLKKPKIVADSSLEVVDSEEFSVSKEGSTDPELSWLVDENSSKLNDDSEKDDQEENVTAWDNFGLPRVLIKALLEQGFHYPTQIQELTLPPAVFGNSIVFM